MMLLLALVASAGLYGAAGSYVALPNDQTFGISPPGGKHRQLYNVGHPPDVNQEGAFVFDKGPFMETVPFTGKIGTNRGAAFAARFRWTGEEPGHEERLLDCGWTDGGGFLNTPMIAVSRRHRSTGMILQYGGEWHDPEFPGNFTQGQWYTIGFHIDSGGSATLFVDDEATTVALQQDNLFRDREGWTCRVAAHHYSTGTPTHAEISGLFFVDYPIGVGSLRTVLKGVNGHRNARTGGRADFSEERSEF